MSLLSFTKLRLGQFELLRLENHLVQVDILPELGGKIWNLTQASGKQWLWHNPSVALQRAESGASYDDNWAGGWEELFPNDAPGEFRGRMLPDHGEWWSQPWQWSVSESSTERIQVRLWRSGVATETLCEKWITIESDRASVSIRYRIQNQESASLHFLFKQHLAVAVTAADRLELPGGEVTPVDQEFSTRIGECGPHDWPIARDKDGEKVDLSILPPREEKHREFVYIKNLPEGWCGIRDGQTGSSLRLHFPREVFPYTWIFMTFGGWRDLYTVVLEPCTNMPKDLQTALESNQCATLLPQAALDCEVRVELS